MINEAEAKYNAEGPFNEPVLKCDACQKLILLKTLHKVGKCPHCGNTRVRNVNQMTEEDQIKAKEWVESGDLDPDWLKLFEPCEVVV